MAIDCYLAMTAAEIHRNSDLPPHIGWMACHFSPYGTGLSNLPRVLPEGAMLILNDRIPICAHDSHTVCEQLAETVTRLKCGCVLLDFQRPENLETAALAEYLLEELPCPAAVSKLYAGEKHPVFLPPVPPDILPETYLSPWMGQEIWLEAALSSTCLRLTSQGCSLEADCVEDDSFFLHRSEALYCHYRIELNKDSAMFHLRRTREDLSSLLANTEVLGVTRAVGLWQELGEK